MRMSGKIQDEGRHQYTFDVSERIPCVFPQALKRDLVAKSSRIDEWCGYLGEIRNEMPYESHHT